jgi:hypothetical protein
MPMPESPCAAVIAGTSRCSLLMSNWRTCSYAHPASIKQRGRVLSAATATQNRRYVLQLRLQQGRLCEQIFRHGDS